ncbi:hypothetical protein ACFSUK_12875 [Sphingobium scionense]
MLDHWPIDVLGARMTLVADGDMVSALKFTFTGQPTTLAPALTDPGKPGQPPKITINDRCKRYFVSRFETASASFRRYFTFKSLSIGRMPNSKAKRRKRTTPLR